MTQVPAKVVARVGAGLKKFQPVLDDAKKRDVNESDTVTIVTDILNDIFGYDKYSEITSEHSIRSTFCDLAIKVEGELIVLIEVKAVGIELKDTHAKQAVDYAANQGCEWVVLTNGVTWRVFQVQFAKPIQADLVLDLNLMQLNPRKSEDVELLALLSHEASRRSKLDDYALQKQALSRFTIAAVILNGPCLLLLRRELRRISKDVKIEPKEIEKMLMNEVLKREAIEGDKAEAARRLVTRASRRALRSQDATSKPTP